MKNIFFVSSAMILTTLLFIPGAEGKISPPLPVSTAAPRVFPGAEGFGTETRAGRGGAIIKVTRLNDSGAGTLRAAIETAGPRIIVFEVSGTIRLITDLVINNPFVTIAGQSAPSPGISLRGAGIRVKTHDVLLQHLRIRVGDDPAGPAPGNRDALQILGNKDDPTSIYNVVVDHVSASWAIDENLSTWFPLSDITISNSIISEGLDNSFHSKGPHSKGLLVGDLAKNVTVIGNLMAHNASRNPMVKGGCSTVVVNNVSYNAKNYDFFATVDDYNRGPTDISAVSNVFISGPNTAHNIPAMGVSKVKRGTKIYQNGNLYAGKILSSTAASFAVSTPPIWVSPLTILNKKQVEAAVLTNAGARPADRDAVDARIIEEVRSRSGKIISSQIEVGGWPVLTENVRPFPLPIKPNNDDDNDGYTNIEEVLHRMADDVTGK